MNYYMTESFQCLPLYVTKVTPCTWPKFPHYGQSVTPLCPKKELDSRPKVKTFSRKICQLSWVAAQSAATKSVLG